MSTPFEALLAAALVLTLFVGWKALLSAEGDIGRLAGLCLALVGIVGTAWLLTTHLQPAPSSGAEAMERRG